MPGGQTAAHSVPSGQNARAQEEHGLTEDEASLTVAPSSPHIEAGGQTADLGGLTASSCRAGASSSANNNSSSAGMEEDADDDLLDYEPSPARDGMEINIIYL
jgi:hypothetical protein